MKKVSAGDAGPLQPGEVRQRVPGETGSHLVHLRRCGPFSLMMDTRSAWARRAGNEPEGGPRFRNRLQVLTEERPPGAPLLEARGDNPS